eukprot:2339160-Pyramimonas_sp.AAC.1
MLPISSFCCLWGSAGGVSGGGRLVRPPPFAHRRAGGGGSGGSDNPLRQSRPHPLHHGKHANAISADELYL